MYGPDQIIIDMLEPPLFNYEDNHEQTFLVLL